jgi:hypothetical protein
MASKRERDGDPAYGAMEGEARAGRTGMAVPRAPYGDGAPVA